MLILTRNDVIRALPMPEAIRAATSAYRAASEGTVEIPLRTTIRCQEGPGISLFMPGYRPAKPGAGESGVLGAKIVSIFERNPARGLATTQAVFLLISPETGEPLAVMDAASLTAIRTGAGSGVATDLLARRDAAVAAIFGAGVQARTQLEAIATVRPLRNVLVNDVDPQRAEAFAHEMTAKLQPVRPGINVRVVADADQAAAEADVIACATTSASPVFCGGSIRPGTHVNAVGSYTPDRRELDEVLLKRAARVVLDSREAVLAEAGDLLIPIGQGLFGQEIISAEVGEILLGRAPARQDAAEITVYKAVGIAALDLMAAEVAYRTAHAAGLGTEVKLS